MDTFWLGFSVGILVLPALALGAFLILRLVWLFQPSKRWWDCSVCERGEFSDGTNLQRIVASVIHDIRARRSGHRAAVKAHWTQNDSPEKYVVRCTYTDDRQGVVPHPGPFTTEEAAQWVADDHEKYSGHNCRAYVEARG